MEKAPDKILDLSGCDDDAFLAVSRGIEMWKNSGEGMRMIADSLYDEDLQDSWNKGLLIGAIAGVAATVIAGGITWLVVKAIEAGPKIRETFHR